jgi:hypothetical protein
MNRSLLPLSEESARLQTTTLIKMSEWQEVSPGVLQRPLRGAELALNHAEHENGNVSMLERQSVKPSAED